MTANPEFLAGQRLPAGKLNRLSPDPISFTPTWANVTVGTGGTSQGYYWYKGNEVGYAIELILGTGGDVTGVIEFDYPTVANSLTATLHVCAVWASLGASTRYAGAGIGDANGITRIASQNTGTGWNATVPFDWTSGSAMRIQGAYLEA